MKKIICIVLLLQVVSSGVEAQPKTKKTDKPPSAKELNDMMKEMQQGMDSNMSPEDKKILDSMGIKMPDFNGMQKSLSAVGADQLNKSAIDMNRLVPVKDMGKIAAIARTPSSIAAVTAFLSATQDKVTIRLKPAAKTKGEEIYQLVKAEYTSSKIRGNMSAGLWMMGKAELALYVMGKLCADDPANDNNLNNYAAMLSMSGGEQFAVPLLDYLNKKYPKNSTILNNIGQAWFGLGEIDKADKYLDTAIRLYPMHPQANYTKSYIEQNRGNKQAAIEAAKRSIKKGYSPEKSARLNKLGYELKGDDISWDPPMPKDALGLEKFQPPAFPMTVDECAELETLWADFNADCRFEHNELKGRRAILEKEMQEKSQARMQLLFAASNSTKADAMPPLAYKAMEKLSYLVVDKDGSKAFAQQHVNELIIQGAAKLEEYKQRLGVDEEAIRKQFENRFGEGKENPFGAHCEAQNSVRNAFLVRANGLLSNSYTAFLEHLRKKINDELYYYQYTQWPDEFEVTKIDQQMMWLSALINLQPQFQNRGISCQYADKDKKPSKKELSKFDDVNCQYHSQMKLVCGTITVDCEKMTGELDLKMVKLGLTLDTEQEKFGDQYMGCSVEVGAGTGVGVNAGPFKAEASIGGGVRAEFGRNGLTDIIVKASAGAGVGTTIIDKAADALDTKGSMAGQGISDLSVDVGVKGQISIISGKSSVESTGILEGVLKK